MKSAETVVIRSRGISNDLLSAFGSTPKETRLTALLGYLLYLEHKSLLEVFGIKRKITSIRLEYVMGSQRTDIIVTADPLVYIIEAKLYTDDPYTQLIKQFSEIKRIPDFKGMQIKLFALTQSSGKSKKGRVNYISWSDLYKKLKSSNSKLNSKQKFLGEEFMKHLENQGIVRNESGYEVYARELNSEINLRFFLQGRLYFCKKENKTSIKNWIFFFNYPQRYPNVFPLLP